MPQVRHFLVHMRRAGSRSARPLNCGVMRSTSDPGARSVSSRALCVVAVVCFAPLVLVLVLGLVAVPVWVGMIAMHLAEPERFSPEVSGTIWDGVWPLALVLSGLLGVVGLFRALALPRREASALSRRATLAMIVVGLAALAAFDLVVIVPGILSEPAEELPIAGLAVYVVLPFVGAAWLFFALRKSLFAVSQP